MQAKKSLGQHFLTNPHVAERVADAARVAEGDTVLEIGPGKGILTEILLRKSRKVIAVEKDCDLIPVLQEKFQKEILENRLVLLEGDVLDEEIQEKIFQHIPNSYKIAANIPYFITGKLLRLFLSFSPQPENCGLLVQKEVAERVAGKGGKESILSMSVKAYGDPKYAGIVKAGNFSPPPKVDSAILGIENISRDFFDTFTEEDFFALIKAGFAHKRKLLRKNVEQLLPNRVFYFENISEKARAEDLRLTDWKSLLG